MIRITWIVLIFSALSFGQSVEDCMECHSDETLTKSVNDSVEMSLYVDLQEYKTSIHGDMDCVDCHNTIKDLDHEPDLPPVDCSICHDGAAEEYAQSIHATSEKNSHLTAHCESCHGKHNIRPASDSLSTVYKLNIEKTCGNCHSRPDVLAILGLRGKGPVEGYEHSVHNRILHEAPDKNAPTCISCHGYHEIYLMSDPRSSFNKLNRAETCGECHTKEKVKYYESIHWDAVKRGHFEAPTCNDCHGEHDIASPEEATAVTNRLNLSSQVCAKCHSSRTMMRRFGLDPGRFDSYMKTYHGLAVLKDSPDAANCTSCHEVHAIRSQTDPKSSVNKANLQTTCGKCHKNITADFISVPAHPKDMEARNPVAYYAQYVYIWLLVIVVGGMIVHNLIIFRYYIRKKQESLKTQRTYLRFQKWEIGQHGLLLISFFTLVITGFALKFPEALWAKGLASIGLEESLRSLIHRVAAVVLIIISTIQLVYFIISRRGRREVGGLIPKVDDVTGFWANMKFYLGRSAVRPKFGRWDYTEKVEYLALIWGTAIMVLTGLVLWFPEILLRFLPSWSFEVSEVIHYFEAWLATLAIIIWHWFFVIFHPEKYPMSLTWLNGKITEEELKHHHPLEYEAMKKENEQPPQTGH